MVRAASQRHERAAGEQDDFPACLQDRIDRFALVSAQGLPLRVVQKGWQRCPCHVIAMLLPCHCHDLAKSLPCHGLAIAMLLPSYCHVVAMLLPCCCHVSYHDPCHASAITTYYDNNNDYYYYCCCCCFCYYYYHYYSPFALFSAIRLFLPSDPLLLVSPTRLPYLLFLPLVSISALASYSTMLSSCSCMLLALLQAGGEEAAAEGDCGPLPVPPPRALTVPPWGAGTNAWSLTESRALEKLTDVLEERKVELNTLRLDEFAFLPLKNQREVQQRLRQRWLQSQDGKYFAQAAWQKTSSSDAYRRTLESYYRKSQHEDYGGRLWQYCLVALGHLPPRQELLTRKRNEYDAISR